MDGVNVFRLFGELAINGVNEAREELNDLGGQGERTRDELAASFQDMGAKAGELGKKLALGIAGAVASVVALVEGTRELRQDLGKLETTFETTNHGSESATKTFKELYGILGEDDTAIEAANHLALMTENEKELEEWTDILTGVYATFGDSLPLEGLAEAANETARVGQVTGPLADALNWLGVNEDEFNEKLAKTNSEQERNALIRDTLNGLYGEASNTYKKTNSEVIKGNKAQADLNLKMAEFANKLQPLVTKGKEFLVEVLDKLSPAITWVVDNLNILAPIVLGFLGTLFALNIASKVKGFITTLQVLNATMAANPIGLIIIAIGLLVTAFVTLWNNCEGFREFWINLFENIKNAVSVAVEVIVEWFNKIIDFVKENWQALLLLLVNPFAGAFKLLYDNCEGFREFVDNFVQKVKDFFVNGFNSIKEKVTTTFSNFKEGLINIITSIRDGIVNRVTSLKDGVVNRFNSIKDTATNVFNKVKTAITGPIEKARDVVEKVVNKIKGFFNFKVSLPKIKLPHFSITPKGWEIGDLLEGVIPKLGIEWYAKAMKAPMLLDKPTAFGISPNGNLRVGGEAGTELVGGANTVMGMIASAVNGSNAGLEGKLDRLVVLLTNYLPELANRQVVLSTGELVGAMVNPLDVALGELADRKRRGY